MPARSTEKEGLPSFQPSGLGYFLRQQKTWVARKGLHLHLPNHQAIPMAPSPLPLEASQQGSYLGKICGARRT